MTTKEKATLLGQASKLYTLGRKVEKCRDKLCRLVEKKVPYDSQQMIDALYEFNTVNSEWNRLEQEHLKYRAQLGVHEIKET